MQLNKLIDVEKIKNEEKDSTMHNILNANDT